MKNIKILLFALLVGGMLVSCFKDRDDEIGFASENDIKSFIYHGLNYFYLYKSGTAELADDYFTSPSERNDFLKTFSNPESLFDYLLVEEDRFSILVSDYRQLEQALDGTFLDNGMRFVLVKLADTGEIFGAVRYVSPNTSAAEKGLQRGMIFTTVNGENLTESNYQKLLAPVNYSIGLATMENNELTPTGESIALTKEQYTENPIHITKTLTVNGQKIGYLMYNAFTADFDSQLNAVFADFKAEGISDLVLDLRYNGGGSIETANDLSSMITGQFNGELFIKQVYNENFPSFERTFNNKIEATGEAINNLNLSRVFVLTTFSSASASELVISALRPYINVIQIGGATAGKFQGSIIVYDSPDYSRENATLGHRYAMLPLVLKSVNANGFTDYAEGIQPQIMLQEDYANMGVLGQPDEPLLAAALDQIDPGRGFPERVSSPNTFTAFSESKAGSPMHQRMFSEKQIP